MNEGRPEGKEIVIAEPSGLKESWPVAALGVAFFVAVLVASNDAARDFVVSNWVLVVGVVVALVVVLLIFGGVKLSKSVPAGTKAALVVFVVLPAAIALIGLIGIVVPPSYQVTALRSVFLLIVGLLPATLWWLFVSQRKTSLLNDYVTDLSHLGLLECQETEDEAGIRRRLQAYRKKFEAAYGSLAPGQFKAAVDGRYSEDLEQSPIAGAVTSAAAVPVVVATVLIALGWLLALPPLFGSVEGSTFIERWLTALRPQQDAVAFAFLGSYFYAIQLLFRRYVLSDLQATAYVAITIRILLSVIGTWAVVTAFEDQFDQTSAMVLGFVIGVFPRVALQALEALVKTTAGLVIPSLKPRFPLRHLDAMTVWHESRLEEEDIENVPSMASANVADLLLRTRFSPDRVIDWVDQAILYTALGDPKESHEFYSTLRGFGIRSATSLRAALDDGLPEAASMHSQRLSVVYRGIADIPNLRLVDNWRRVKAPVKLEDNGAATVGAIDP